MKRFLLIFQLLLFVGITIQAQINVDTIDELESAITTIGNDETIFLSNMFPDDFDRKINILIDHDRNFTIDGGSREFTVAGNFRHFEIKKTDNYGSVTLNNLKFMGSSSGTDGGGVAVSSGSVGTIIFDNLYFESNKGGALSYHGINASAQVIVRNSTFVNNSTGGHGGAIYANGGDLLVDHCTFDGNSSAGAGYSGGAVAVFNYTGEAIIRNSVFVNNTSLEHGGAFSAYNSKAVVTVSYCYFEGNSVTNNDGKADGGAISIYGGGQSAVDFTLTNSTFYRNYAEDDAGAVFLENYINGSSNKILNCTMYENSSSDCSTTTATSGGAIQLSWSTIVTLENNTIIGNYTKHNSGTGGGLGCHYYWREPSTSKSTWLLKNNIILGNYALHKTSNNVVVGTRSNVAINSYGNLDSNSSGNIGLDNGTAFDRDVVNFESVLGASTPQWNKIDNESIKIGNPNEEQNQEYFRGIPTISIRPYDPLNFYDHENDISTWDNVNYSADGKAMDSSMPADQREYDRVDPSDVGAVEILWAKFDAYIDGTDDGYWEGLSDLTYDGTIFYEKDGEDKAKEYFVVSHYDGTIGAQSTIPEPIHSTLSFGGWVEIDEDGTEIGDWDGLAFDLTSNRRFRAKWDGGTTPTIYDIIYHPNGGGGVSQTIPAEDDNTHTILKYTDTPLEFTPPANHVFAGWNTLADGSGAAYVVNTTTEPLEANLELYALWTARPVTPEEPEEPEPDLTAILQWSVSTTTPSAFVDVENNTRTIVYKGTPVYLQIRPIVNIPSRFDSWEIEYTAIPADYHHSMTPISGTLRYNFNEGQPHLLPGTYIYTVHSLTLYRYGNAVAAFDFETSPYEHTIIINSKPDPNTDSAIQLRDIAGYCADETELRIPYSLIYEDYPVEYTVIFSDKAKSAGFKNITEYTLLPDNYISIPIPAGVPSGKYQGEIMLRCEENLDIIPNYPFEVEILPTVQIVRQPETVISGKCVGDGYRIEVEATGLALSYQWYHNDQIIVGATSASYEAVLADETTGTYYVVVTGTCGMVVSDKVNIGINALTLLIKWDDVLYVVNTDNRYTRFQWYKDGQAINMNGNSIYYTDQAGLQGTYFLRAYTSADSYEESCPVTFSSISRASRLSVYPNIVSQNYHVTIESDEVGETYIGAAIDMFNMAGQKVYAGRVTSAKVEIPMTVPSGSYILHITAANGKKTVEKIIVK